MQTAVYCHHCEKTYETTQDDLVRMQRFQPEYMVFSGSLYSYIGGCYFKTLSRLKRMDKPKTDNKEAT